MEYPVDPTGDIALVVMLMDVESVQGFAADGPFQQGG